MIKEWSDEAWEGLIIIIELSTKMSKFKKGLLQINKK